MLRFIQKPTSLLAALMLISAGLLLLACEEKKPLQATLEPELEAQSLVDKANVVEPLTVTDQIRIADLDISLLDESGACMLGVASEQNRYLKPMAPCYFVRLNGELQRYQKADVAVIALVGTPVKPRCGQEAQALFIDKDGVRLSKRIAQGSIYCADKGLDAFNMSLFAEELE